MNKWQKTDVLVNVKNKPFITLTESKITNVWYHDEVDTLFCLTALGFRAIIGSKNNLFELNLQKA